jgi:hypothetical protein
VVSGEHVQVVRVDNHPDQPLTDAQLRAASLPVQVAGLPLPAGAATESTLDALRLAAVAIRSAAETLAGRTINTSAVAGTVALDAPTLAALETINATTGGLTDAQLRASPVSVGGAVAVSNFPAGFNVDTGLSQGLTDAQLRAAAVPVSVPGVATQATLAAILAAYKNEDAPAASGDLGLPMLATRQIADTTSTDADGDYTLLKIDEEGRLKVSTKPASYPDITGDITAIQPTIGTPVAGGTVGGDVSRASNIMAFCTGTFAGVNVTFEASLESTGETNWFGIQAIRSNANTIETATGVLAAQPVYGWEMSVNAIKRVRVRCTARTSGTQSWRFVQGTYATEPIPAAQVSATQPVSGTVTATVTAGTVNPVVPATPYILNSLASTNEVLILTGTSGLQAFYATNTGASVAFVKLYNKATAPASTDVPAMILPVPAAVSGVPGVATLPIGFSGFRFALGLGIRITGAVADNDTTAVAAGQVKVMLSRTV